MYQIYNKSNKRGTAIRSNDRNTRYATHIPVLRECISSLNASESNPIYAVEHGMGLGSTPFFHSLPNIKKITSFERELEWMRCDNCISGSQTPHEMALLKDDNAVSQTQCGITNPKMTIALVDGYASQRGKVLEAWMKLDVKFIIEHDAEVLTHDQVQIRRRYAKENGYLAVQYMGHDPESVLYAKDTLPTLTNNYQSL
jgi:hypothetical protein